MNNFGNLYANSIDFNTAGVYQLFNNRHYMELHNINTPFVADDLYLQNLKLIFNRIGYNRGELFIYDSSIIGSIIGIELFDDAKLYIENTILSNMIYSINMYLKDDTNVKSNNITLNNVKFNNIGPYYNNLFQYFWDFIDLNANSWDLTPPTLISENIFINNCVFNYASPWGFLNIINSNNVILRSNTFIYNDTTNGFDYIKAKYGYFQNNQPELPQPNEDILIQDKSVNVSHLLNDILDGFGSETELDNNAYIIFNDNTNTHLINNEFRNNMDLNHRFIEYNTTSDNDHYICSNKFENNAIQIKNGNVGPCIFNKNRYPSECYQIKPKVITNDSLISTANQFTLRQEFGASTSSILHYIKIYLLIIIIIIIEI